MTVLALGEGWPPRAVEAAMIGVGAFGVWWDYAVVRPTALPGAAGED